MEFGLMVPGERKVAADRLRLPGGVKRLVVGQFGGEDKLAPYPRRKPAASDGWNGRWQS